MEYIVDVQGFKKQYNQFVVKELAIIPLEEDALPIVYLFESPHDWNLLDSRYKCENSWLTKNYHGISWQEGDVPYRDFEEILKASVRCASKIYVKGLEKLKWLQNIIPNVRNMEDLDCPSLSKLHKDNNIPCSNHNLQMCKNSHCAASNALVLKKWLLDMYNTPAFLMYKETDQESDFDY